MSVWIKCSERLPDTDRNVLAVKELKSGHRDICIARCIPTYPKYHHETKTYTEEPYWVCGGNNHVICWAELPEMPAE